MQNQAENQNEIFDTLRGVIATERQINKIIYLLESSGDSKTLEMTWDNIPKNSKEYPDVRADYRRQIVADKLARVSRSQASYIIDGLENKTNLKRIIETFKSLRIII